MGQLNWILLRGLGRESGHWGPFVDLFKSRFPRDSVLAIDYPGVGMRRKETAPISIAGLAKSVAQAVENFSPQETIVVGHSLGGMVALEVAAQNPALRGTVLINSSVGGISRWQERIEVSSALEVARVFATANPKSREEKILQLVSREPDRHGQILQTWVKLAESRPIQRQVIMKQLLAASRFRLPKTCPESRSLVLAALGDKLVNPGCSEALGEKLKVKVRFHPWAGHELSLDDPEWLLTEVERWSASSKPLS